MGGKRFRPDERTLKQLEDLAAMHLSVPAIAAVLNTSARTLERRYAELIQKGRGRGKAALMQKIWSKALEKDNTEVQLKLADRILWVPDEADDAQRGGDTVYETQWGGNSEPSDDKEDA